MMIFFYRSEWMISLVGEYLDIFEITRLALTCRHLYDDPTIDFIYLNYQSKVIDSFTFLLKRYQGLLKDLFDDSTSSDEEYYGECIKKIEYSWYELKRFVFEIYPKYDESVDIDLDANILFQWDMSNKDCVDMSMFMTRLQSCILCM